MQISNPSTFEQSAHLRSLMSTIDRLLDIHALTFQATAEFYQRVMAGPSVVQFPLSGTTWRPGMSKDKVINHAPMLTQVAALQSSVLLAGALEYYLYKMCQLTYSKMDLVDRTWFNFDVVGTLTGVDMALCLQYPKIVELFALWAKYVKPEQYDIDPNVMANRSVFQEFADAVRIFAIDFEHAFCLSNIRVRLPQ